MGKGKVMDDRLECLDQDYRIVISLINYTMGRQGAAPDAQNSAPH
jgi:hypothetical protein